LNAPLRFAILTCIFKGHIGDGNFHCILLYNPQLDGDEGLIKLQSFNDRLVTRALKMEGTCTGEHGVGYGKKAWLEVEHGQSAVSLMRNLKRAVDPHCILNPGKVI
jgi:D-lactate dehydrogenase (cytochrome)